MGEKSEGASVLERATRAMRVGVGQGERERWRRAGLLGRGEKGAGLRFAGLGYWVLGFLSFILIFSNSISHSSSTI